MKSVGEGARAVRGEGRRRGRAWLVAKRQLQQQLSQRQHLHQHLHLHSSGSGHYLLVLLPAQAQGQLQLQVLVPVGGGGDGLRGRKKGVNGAQCSTPSPGPQHGQQSVERFSQWASEMPFKKLRPGHRCGGCMIGRVWSLCGFIPGTSSPQKLLGGAPSQR